MTDRTQLNGNSQVVGLDQQVGVVEQDDLGPLGQQEEGELDEEHQSQLADAADVQEDRAGQQGQQHAVAEILWRGQSGGRAGGEKVTPLLFGPRRQAHARVHRHCGLTSGKWQAAAVWLEHTVKPSSAAELRLCRRQRVTLATFRSLATQSSTLSVLQVNWRGETTGGRPSNHATTGLLGKTSEPPFSLHCRYI